MNWEAVLELATDAQRPEDFGSRDPGDPQNAAIRRHAIAVMDAVDRNGLVAPWTAVPHLLALTTDPNRWVPEAACPAEICLRGYLGDKLESCPYACARLNPYEVLNHPRNPKHAGVGNGSETLQFGLP